MEISDISQLIASIGFPIVACGALFWLLRDQSNQHREEMMTIKESIDELKIAIVQLSTQITALINSKNI